MAEKRSGLSIRATGKAPDNLRYELASLEDAAQCNDINNGYLKRDRSLSQWLWEFQPPHIPFSDVPYAIARDNGRIVGTQGFIVVPMISRDGIFWAAKGEDALVLPKYWGRPVLDGMWGVLKDLCQRRGLRLVWGFNAAKGSFTRIGLRYFDEPFGAEWYYAFDRGAMDLVLERTTRMKQRFSGVRGGAAKLAISSAASLWGGVRSFSTSALGHLADNVPKDLVVAPLEGDPQEEFDALSRAFVDCFGGITLHRSAAFLKWRLIDNPFVPSTIITARVGGVLVGYLAYSQIGRRGFITDQMSCAGNGDGKTNTAILERLLATALKRLRKKNASVLYSQSFNAHPADASFQSALRRMGFLKRSQKFGACFLGVPQAGDLPPSTTTDYNIWYVTGLYNEGRQG